MDADILDSETRFHRSLAFKKSGNPTLCYICGDSVLGDHFRHSALAGNLLEALVCLSMTLFSLF